MHLYSLLNAACISYCGCKEGKKMAKISKATTSDSTQSRATASALLDAEEAGPSGATDSHPPPTPYDLDDRMDITEEPPTGVPTPTPTPQQLTDEQLDADMYGSNEE